MGFNPDDFEIPADLNDDNLAIAQALREFCAQHDLDSKGKLFKTCVPLAGSQRLMLHMHRQSDLFTLLCGIKVRATSMGDLFDLLLSRFGMHCEALDAGHVVIEPIPAKPGRKPGCTAVDPENGWCWVLIGTFDGGEHWAAMEQRGGILYSTYWLADGDASHPSCTRAVRALGA